MADFLGQGRYLIHETSGLLLLEPSDCFMPRSYAKSPSWLTLTPSIRGSALQPNDTAAVQQRVERIGAGSEQNERTGSAGQSHKKRCEFATCHEQIGDRRSAEQQRHCWG